MHTLSPSHTSPDEYNDQPDILNEHVQEPGDPDGIVAAEKQQQWQEGQPASVHPVQSYEPPSRLSVIMFSTALIVVVVVGAYFLGFHHAQVPVAKKAQAEQNKSERKLSPVTTATKRYDSTRYALSFDYPSNWIVSDTDAKLTVISPNYTMQDEDGSTTGHVLVAIQNQQSSLPGYPSGGANASLDSSTITYKQPSGLQRSSTYLSYAGYSGGGTINALYLTGDTAYKAGAELPLVDIIKGNPLISVRFQQCAKSYCTSGKVTPIAIAASSWKNAAFRTQVTSLLQSLVLN